MRRKKCWNNRYCSLFSLIPRAPAFCFGDEVYRGRVKNGKGGGDLSHEQHWVNLRWTWVGGGGGGRVGPNCNCVCTEHGNEFLSSQAEQFQLD